MISFTDFQDEKGHIDWARYREAQTEAGEHCYKCGAFIFPGKGYRTTCFQCNTATLDLGEITHDRFMRCPHCGDLSPALEHYNDMYNEGEHDVYCQKCDKEFRVKTHVSYSFTSPPRTAEQKEEEEDEEAADSETEGDS